MKLSLTVRGDSLALRNDHFAVATEISCADRSCVDRKEVTDHA